MSIEYSSGDALRNMARRSTTLPTNDQQRESAAGDQPRRPAGKDGIARGPRPAGRERARDRHRAEQGHLAERDHACDQLARVEHGDDPDEAQVERDRPADEPDLRDIAPGGRRLGRRDVRRGSERAAAAPAVMPDPS